MKSAVVFYESALNCDKPVFTNEFVYEIYYDYYPLTWLTSVYYELKQIEKAKFCAEECAKLFPEDELAINNLKFFL